MIKAVALVIKEWWSTIYYKFLLKSLWLSRTYLGFGQIRYVQLYPTYSPCEAQRLMLFGLVPGMQSPQEVRYIERKQIPIWTAMVNFHVSSSEYVSMSQKSSALCTRFCGWVVFSQN